MCMSTCLMHVYVYHMCAELVEAREGARYPWTKVTEDWELPSGHWKLSLNRWQEEQEPLTTESSSAPQHLFFKHKLHF